MHRKTAERLFVLAALGASACTGRGPVAPSPAPVAVARPAPVDTVAPIGEGFELKSTRPATVGTDLLGTAQYDLPVEANEWVRMELDFLVNQRHDVVGRWLEQADRYDEWVRDVFASYGIPRDLHHLGMVESGYRPTVRSHAGAVGMWQFMPATGRGMGLRIDSLVDERMDPVRATHAAARHLRDLSRQFRGDWALAAAAYNAGSGRINRGLGRFGATTFWELAQRGDLAQETRHYVPRLYAVTIIAKDPARFGYRAPSGPVRRFEYDSMRVDLVTPLPVLAQAGNIPVDDLVDLNPHLIRQVAPANYWVWVPAGQGNAVQQAYASSEFRQRGGYGYYRVREGDSLERLAELSGVSAERIRALNLSTGLEPLRPGTRVRLFADAARTLESRPAPRVARSESPRGDAERSGDERRGEGESSTRTERTASASRRTASSEGERASGNEPRARREADSEPRSSARTEGGSRSSGTVRRSSSASGGTADASRSTTAGASRAASGRTHTVADGETLWGIARRYDVTVDAMREENDLGDGAIQPGQTLRIPRSSSTVASSAGSGRMAESEPVRTSGGGERSSTSASTRRATSTAQQHTVADGETLWGIARRYNTTVDTLRRANGLAEGAAIQPGQRLTIPAN